MAMKLNVWYIQQAWDHKRQKWAYQALRFKHRDGKPEKGKYWPTIAEARNECGFLSAELI